MDNFFAEFTPKFVFSSEVRKGKEDNLVMGFFIEFEREKQKKNSLFK